MPPPNLARRSFPARLADLGFDLELPSDWIAHDLPADVPDFAVPTALAPLACVSAPHAAIVFVVAARPAFADGTLHDWAMHLLVENGLKPRALGRASIGGVPAIAGEAVESSDVGALVVRFAFFEDGDRLVNLSLTAPELLADAVSEVWFAALRTFRLAAPRGSRFGDGADDAPAVAPAAAAATEPEPSSPRTFAAFATEVDAASLDPEEATNRNLRDRGVGLVPRLAGVAPGERRATVAAGALGALFDVPFGWHVVDDGRRALMFEPTGRIQIHLDRLQREGRDDDALLDGIEAQMRADYAAPEFLRVSLGRIRALGARHIADGDQPLEQYHLLLPRTGGTEVVRARVTATPETAIDACDLAELVLNSLVFPEFADDAADVDAASGDGAPDWWRRAQELEAQDRCGEAEEQIRSALPHAGSDQTIAVLYRQRMSRLLRRGDRAGAREAFDLADGAMCRHASLATSGGEGVARSDERDRFRASLVAEFGGDPEARGAADA